MQLTSFCMVLTCLRVSPDRSQFSRWDSITLSCEDQLNSTGWRVKRNTSKGGITCCSFGWGSTSAGAACFIGSTYPSDSGVYWCESASGEKSNAINITITDRTVILESPALPVAEGAAVTLGCKTDANSSNQGFNFYKDGRSIGNSSTGELTIHSVSKSDEGLYTCSVSGGEESVGSWLAVKASPPTPPPASSASPCAVSVPRLMCHLMVGTPYLLSTILLGLVYRDRMRAARTVAERRGSKDVVMEIVG
uniref:Fc receptor-like protein 5 isoform X2 n=1 Tax=Semicossyphus pulcher TaxID=241346 RepID=UPI0037E7D1FB